VPRPRGRQGFDRQAKLTVKADLPMFVFWVQPSPMDGRRTHLLQDVEAGDSDAAGKLLPLVYDELRRLAAVRLAGEQRNDILQPTALVHEAWLKIAGTDQRAWNGQEHFFAAAAEAMRRILVDHARRRLAAKRGGGAVHLVVEDMEWVSPGPDEQMLDVNDALEKFSLIEPRKAELVKLRYFVGMSFGDAALVLGIAVPTAKQWWAYARAWLRVEMAGNGPGGDRP
jgi:RNA polymerase sigma factor (TIGR02999 family)